MFALEDLELLLDIEATPQTGALLELSEAAAVALIERETGRYFGPIEADFAEYLTGTGRGSLWLSHDPADDLITVSETDSGEPTTELGATDWVLRNRRQLVRTNRGVWTAGAEYHVAYARGYEPYSEPAEIRDAVLALVRYRLTQSQNPNGLLKSETLGSDYSYTISETANVALDSGLGSVRDVIDLWKRPVA